MLTSLGGTDLFSQVGNHPNQYVFESIKHFQEPLSTPPSSILKEEGVAQTKLATQTALDEFDDEMMAALPDF